MDDYYTSFPPVEDFSLDNISVTDLEEVGCMHVEIDGERRIVCRLSTSFSDSSVDSFEIDSMEILVDSDDVNTIVDDSQEWLRIHFPDIVEEMLSSGVTSQPELPEYAPFEPESIEELPGPSSRFDPLP